MIKEKDYIYRSHNIRGATHISHAMTSSTAERLLEVDREENSHLMIVMDTFDYDTYRVEVPNGKLEEYKVRFNSNMQKILEIVELEPTNEVIKNYLNRNKPSSFKDFAGREIE